MERMCLAVQDIDSCIEKAQEYNVLAEQHGVKSVSEAIELGLISDDVAREVVLGQSFLTKEP